MKFYPYCSDTDFGHEICLAYTRFSAAPVGCHEVLWGAYKSSRSHIIYQLWPLMDNHDEDKDSLDGKTLEDIVKVATSVAFIYAKPLFNKIPYQMGGLAPSLHNFPSTRALVAI